MVDAANIENSPGFGYLPEQSTDSWRGPPRAPMGKAQYILNRFYFLRDTGLYSMPDAAYGGGSPPWGGGGAAGGDGQPPFPPGGGGGGPVKPPGPVPHPPVPQPNPDGGGGGIPILWPWPQEETYGGGPVAPPPVPIPDESTSYGLIASFFPGFYQDARQNFSRVASNFDAVETGLSSVASTAVGENLILNADFASKSGGATAVPDGFATSGTITFPSVATGVSFSGTPNQGTMNHTVNIKAGTNYTLSLGNVSSDVASSLGFSAAGNEGSNFALGVTFPTGTTKQNLNATISIPADSAAASMTVKIGPSASALATDVFTIETMDLHLGSAATPDPLGYRDYRVEPRGYNDGTTTTTIKRYAHELHEIAFGVDDLSKTRTLIGTARDVWSVFTSTSTNPANMIYYVSATTTTSITVSRHSIGKTDTVFADVWYVPAAVT